MLIFAIIFIRVWIYKLQGLSKITSYVLLRLLITLTIIVNLHEDRV